MSGTSVPRHTRRHLPVENGQVHLVNCSFDQGLKTVPCLTTLPGILLRSRKPREFGRVFVDDTLRSAAGTRLAHIRQQLPTRQVVPGWHVRGEGPFP